MLKMLPTLSINLKDAIDGELILLLHAAVKNGCYKIAKYLIKNGVDINSVSTTIYQGNIPLFLTTKIIDDAEDVFKCSNHDGVENYELNLMPLYISGDIEFSEIIDVIVNKIDLMNTFVAQYNILIGNTRKNRRVLRSKNDKETEVINIIISKYSDIIDIKERELGFNILDVPKNNYENSFINSISYQLRVENYSYHEIKAAEKCIYNDIFQPNKMCTRIHGEGLSITDLDVSININNCRNISNYINCSINLTDLHIDVVKNNSFTPNNPKGLFMTYTPLSIGGIKYLANCTLMENCTPLHISADEGCKEICELLLKKGANINATDKNNNTPLHFAVSKGHVKIVKCLVQRGADVNCKNSHDLTALHLAAINGNEDVCRTLLNKRSHINAITMRCNTPLHFAVWKNHPKIAKLLLKYKANINFKDIDGTTALHFAAYKGNEDIVRILLKKGADVNASTKNNNTPLHFAASNGHANIIKRLLECAADITSKDTNGATALHFAAFSGNENICLDLLNRGADIDALACCNVTTIHFAAYSNHEETLKLISKHCPNINIKDASGRTALHIATELNNVNAVRALLECGVNVNAQDFEGVTALHIAGKEGFVKIVQLLLNKGADIHIMLNNGFTCFHIVTTYCTHLVKFFLNYLPNINFEDINFLHVASYYFVRVQNYFKIAELLLSIGADVNHKLEDGYTCIQHIIFMIQDFRPAESLLRFEKQSVIIMKNIIETFFKVLLIYGATLDFTEAHDAEEVYYFYSADFLFEPGTVVNVENFNNATIFRCMMSRFPNTISTSSVAHVDSESDDDPCNGSKDENIETLLKKKIFKKCIREIKIMKNDYICSDISVHDILTKPINKLIIFAKKVNLVQKLKSAEYKCRYPVYANILNKRIELAEENKSLKEYLLSGCIQALEVFFPIIVVNEISKFLNVEDLLNFRKAIDITPNYNLFKWYLKKYDTI